jgi:hypothetical protein
MAGIPLSGDQFQDTQVDGKVASLSDSNVWIHIDKVPVKATRIAL